MEKCYIDRHPSNAFERLVCR